jgi:xanthine dehydrogenase molybdenum-binding subunit
VNTDGTYHGIGVASFICNKGPVAVYGSTNPVIFAARDGTFSLNIGMSNINTSAREQTMICAEALGVPLTSVFIGEVGDTSASNDCGMQGGSSRTGHCGNGVIAAANNLKAQVFPLAAAKLGVTADKLSASNGNIFVTADPTKTTTWAAILGDGNNPPMTGTSFNPMNYTMTTRTGSATVVEVAVHKDTGQVDVTSIVICDDIGRVVYPLGALGQMRAAMVHAIGFTTMWHQEEDINAGVMMNPDFRDHGFPRMTDVPTPSSTQAYFSETIDKLGPFGAKGLGEPPVGSPGPAIANAIYNAIGVRIQEQGVAVVNVLKALGLG